MPRRDPKEAINSVRKILSAVEREEMQLSVYFHEGGPGIRHDYYKPGELSEDDLRERLVALQEVFGAHVERLDVTPEIAQTAQELIFTEPDLVHQSLRK